MDKESKEDWLEKKFSARQLAERVVDAESESSRLRRRCNELEARLKAPEPASRSESEIKAEALDDVWLLQDSCGYADGKVWFWRDGRAGYTPKIDEAHRFTEEEAFRQHRSRETDIPLRLADMEKLARRTVSSEAFFKWKCEAARLRGEGSESK